MAIFYNKKYNITHIIIGYILFFLLGAGSLFLNSSAFVSVQIMPKWYWTLFCGMALLLVCIVLSFFYPTNRMQQKKMISFFCLTIAGLCTAQALYGIFQYAGIFPAVGGFRITGSFDNPAGFAASLCAGFPFFLYFIRKKYGWQRWVSLAAAVTGTAVVLSASRAGIIALFVVVLFMVSYRLKIKTKSKIIILSVSFVLALSGLYFLKKDSADGRLLIWRCTYEMVKDKPVFGYGHGGFKADYMNYQAKYFEAHPDSKFAMLAGNVNRPFNEYLLLLTDYGLAGFILFLVFGWFLWYSFHRNKHKNILTRIVAGCLLSVAVFSFFSYPLAYPFVWIMGILSIFVIICQAKYPVRIPSIIIQSLKLILIPVIVLSCAEIYNHLSAEMLWRYCANQSLLGKTEEMLPMYEHLHKRLANNELFLYNYAAELNVAEQYDKSLIITHECEQLWADYDLQMLMADNYLQLKQYQEAELHYIKASHMCPVKFMPLYKAFQLYEATGNNEKAKQVANVILDKPVKMTSPTIKNIQQEVKQKMKEL
jgi:O-antigen ligase